VGGRVNIILCRMESYPASPKHFSPGVCFITVRICGLGGGMRSTECHSCLKGLPESKILPLPIQLATL